MTTIDPIFSLGELYVSDFIKDGETPRAGKQELAIGIDSRFGAARLTKAVPPEAMFGKYWYRSGTNSSMKIALKEVVDDILKIHSFNDGDVWLDIASNDLTLLSFVPQKGYRLGIDPVEKSFYDGSLPEKADEVIQSFFSKEAYSKSNARKKAKVVTCIAMFYDLDEPVKFLQEVDEVMDEDGLMVIQMSYTPLMIAQLAFDNICAEHLYYHSLSSMFSIVSRTNFQIVDCQLNDVNGGSFRVYLKKKEKAENFYTAPYRDVCKFRIKSLYCFEQENSLCGTKAWQDFYSRILKLKTDTVDFIKQEKAKGKTIYGYGASTKGNTLLQFFGLDNSLITAIAERSPQKYGLRTVGTNIPIISETEMRKVRPDYLLVLPWHFINEFTRRESEYLKGGGKFIVPCPQFKILP